MKQASSRNSEEATQNIQGDRGTYMPQQVRRFRAQLASYEEAVKTIERRGVCNGTGTCGTVVNILS